MLLGKVVPFSGRHNHNVTSRACRNLDFGDHHEREGHGFSRAAVAADESPREMICENKLFRAVETPA